MKKSRTQPKKEKSFVVSIFIGAASALFCGISFLALACLPMLSLEDPGKFAPALGLASLFISTIIGGYLSARAHRKSGLACGALSALLLISTLVLLAFSIEATISISLFSICAPALIVCAAIAGICGVSAPTSKKPKHKIKF